MTIAALHHLQTPGRFMKTLPVFISLASLAFAASSALAADFSINSIGYRYAPSQSEPAVSDKVSKNILTFAHFSVDKLGTNFFTIDLLKSNSADPANNGGGGAQEWYGFYQREFSLAKMTANTTGYGIVKDIKFTGRFDAGTKNTRFAPSPRKLRLGMAVSLPVSAGFWDVGLQAYKESNHNGIVGKAVEFDLAPALVTAWVIPVSTLGTFSGFVDVIGPKGKDGFGAQTKTEVLARAKFMFNVLGPKSQLTAGVGIEHWRNKFGCNNSASVVKNSCKATTPLLLVEYTL
jgi:nucleoside-specific outer membrane channel protein Tsx